MRRDFEHPYRALLALADVGARCMYLNSGCGGHLREDYYQCQADAGIFVRTGFLGKTQTDTDTESH